MSTSAVAQPVAPAPAVAAAVGPRIGQFEITTLRGTKLKTRLTIDSIGRAGAHSVSIHLVEGAARTEVWQRTLDFPAEENGGRYLAEFDLEGKTLRGATLEAVLTACQTADSCSRRAIALTVGDVQFVGRPTYPHLGRANILVQNYGPADTPACVVVITVGHKTHRTLPLKPMIVNQDRTLTFTYDPHHRGRRLKATIKCEPVPDLAHANNHRDLGELP